MALSKDYPPKTKEEIKVCKMIDKIADLDNIRNNKAYSLFINDLSKKELQLNLHDWKGFTNQGESKYDCFEEAAKIETKKANRKFT